MESEGKEMQLPGVAKIGRKVYRDCEGIPTRDWELKIWITGADGEVNGAIQIGEGLSAAKL